MTFKKTIVSQIIIPICSAFSVVAMDAGVLQGDVPSNLLVSDEAIEEVRIFTAPSEEDESAFVKSHNLDFSPSSYQSGSKKVRSCLGLSIDGGGCRGYMPAKWLQVLQTELKEAEEGDLDVPLHRVFDYVGGTSIGGMLALGVADGKTPDELVNIFENEEKRGCIFSTSRKLIRWIDWFGIVSHRYDSVPLEGLLQREFKERTLQDLKTNALVTTCTIDGYPWVFKKGEEGRDDYKIWEVAQSTSAGVFMKLCHYGHLDS